MAVAVKAGGILELDVGSPVGRGLALSLVVIRGHPVGLQAGPGPELLHPGVFAPAGRLAEGLGLKAIAGTAGRVEGGEAGRTCPVKTDD